MYKIEYARGVIKDFRKLPKEVKEKSLEIIENELAKDPYRGKPLTGPYKGLWKYRAGNYRIIYSIEKQSLVIFVLRIRHRKDVYEGIL